MRLLARRGAAERRLIEAPSGIPGSAVCLLWLIGGSPALGSLQILACCRGRTTQGSRKLVLWGHPRWWVLLQSMSALKADWCPYFRGRKMWSPLQPDEVQPPFL